MAIGKTLILGLSALAALALAPAAQAARYVASFQGVVEDGYDALSIFTDTVGTTSLNGLAFRADYIIDTDTPGATHDFYTNEGIEATSLLGYFAENPVKATLTINGRAWQFGSYSGFAYVQNSIAVPPEEAFDWVFYHAGNITGNTKDGELYFEMFSIVNEIATSSQLPGISSYTPQPGSEDNASFQIRRYDEDGALIGMADALLQMRSMVVGPVPVIGAVPEPASWAMMIAGFGLVGGAMRRRWSGSGRALV